MAVALRLSRGGSKKRPYFRIVAADVRAPRDGRYLERLGTYNPMKKKDDPERITLNKDRIKHWLSVGAKPTLRVTKFLAPLGLANKPLIPKQTKQDKPRKKTLEKQQAKEEKLKLKKEMIDTAQTPAEATTAPESKPAEATTAPDPKPTKDDSLQVDKKK
jgi:small subunit ribosomal protein S16